LLDAGDFARHGDVGESEMFVIDDLQIAVLRPREQLVEHVVGLLAGCVVGVIMATRFQPRVRCR